MSINKFLKKTTGPLRVRPGATVDRVLEGMLATGFQGKTLGECYYVWREMLKEKKITVWLGISGAIVPAGMRRLLAYLIRERFVDVVVSTGAQLFHDACEAMGVAHFQGSELADDRALLKEGIDRFYDIYVKEHLQRRVDREVQKFIETLDPAYQYSSREFLYRLGKHLGKMSKDKDSILTQAAEAGVPVFSPALADSSIGYSFVMARRGVRDAASGKGFEETGRATYRYIDQMKDADETVQIAECTPKSGVIYLGGGVPKNFIQQTELLNLILGHELPGHEYAVQITTDNPHFGGLSGCTLDEAVSWGKISRHAKKAQCFCDVTIALPFLVQGLSENESLARKRKKPAFDWSGKRLKIRYL
ncbi:deoxyhypusine synthase [Candidatus Saganbacteria bacterium]|uniref:Deoxyhypusine synthase n=1 Tax=Candidatus Saganbacteria bacterium TaxID=2575572 RepID=A0A9D6YW37_UNCSA|nr:deoxyhypusine synthase [Candidatus Saganbacteria bacterium]